MTDLSHLGVADAIRGVTNQDKTPVRTPDFAKQIRAAAIELQDLIAKCVSDDDDSPATMEDISDFSFPPLDFKRKFTLDEWLPMAQAQYPAFGFAELFLEMDDKELEAALGQIDGRANIDFWEWLDGVAKHYSAAAGYLTALSMRFMIVLSRLYPDDECECGCGGEGDCGPSTSTAKEGDDAV